MNPKTVLSFVIAALICWLAFLVAASSDWSLLAIVLVCYTGWVATSLPPAKKRTP